MQADTHTNVIDRFIEVLDTGSFLEVDDIIAAAEEDPELRRKLIDAGMDHLSSDSYRKMRTEEERVVIRQRLAEMAKRAEAVHAEPAGVHETPASVSPSAKNVVQRISARHTYTPEEMDSITGDMARIVEEIESLKDEKKSQASHFKSEIESRETTLRSLARKRRDGFEMREVEAERVLNYETSRREWYDIKSRELVRDEPFLPEDYQKDLFDAQAENARREAEAVSGDGVATVAELAGVVSVGNLPDEQAQLFVEDEEEDEEVYEEEDAE